MKMNRLIVLVVSLSVVALIGCTAKEVSFKLPALKSLSADSIETPPILLSVTSVFTVGSDTLGVYQSKDDTLFSFWKLPECRFLFKAGVKGKGPNDFLDLDRTFQGRTGGFKAFEIQTGKVKDVTITNEGRFEVKAKRLKVRETMNRFIFLENNTYCFFLLMGESEFGLYSEKDGLQHFGQYPDLISKNEDELDVFVYNKLTVAHPAGGKFAAFYAYLKMCRIYDSGGTLLKEVYLDGPVELENGMRKTYYATQPYATDEHIYVLAKEKEGNVLEVWNWEAQIEERFLLDKDFDNLVVYDGKLLGFSNELENFVYVYDLK